VKWFQTASLSIFLLVISGCASVGNSSKDQWLYPPMAIALQPNLQQQVQIARLTQLLQRPDLSDEIRAKMFFERGNYYDSVGLRDLARVDFEQSLALNPVQPDVFNLLGVYFTERGEFDSAYDAFDSTLELDPGNTYAQRNRAIALYYGDRVDLALEDMQKQYQVSQADPFSALWLYIIESDLDAEKARKDLQVRYQNRNQEWGWVLVAVVLRDVSDEQALRAIISETRDNTLLAQRLTETYFYMAKRNQQEGDYASAISLYKLALSFNVYEYVEHRYSFLELERIFNDVRDEQQAKAEQAASQS